MSLRDDFYSKEATLVNNAKRELANGEEKDPIYKLRLMCFAKGATGILSLAKSLRKMDKGSNVLGLEDLKEGIKRAGLDWNQDEIKPLFNSFDSSPKNCVSTTEFLTKLRPSMTRSRLNIIDKAFAKIDNNNDGVITINDLKNVYCVRDHPKYLSGELTEPEILKQFLDNFHDDPNSKQQGKVTKEEFINYYATISASINNDAYFDLVMRRAYKL